jgi:PLP dependent protein
MINAAAWQRLQEEFSEKNVTLVAVSKTKPASDIQALYDLGQRHFGENYVQELTEKEPQLPKDIKWHFIGHLQGNKVKYIAPFVHLIHAVDSLKLLQEINKQAIKNNRVIDVLLQLYVANEETKFGLDEQELTELLVSYETEKEMLANVHIRGLMGMATNTDNEDQVRTEFARLHSIFNHVRQRFFSDKDYFSTCSMGMSGDYELAISAGSNMVRIGSLLFGTR